MPKQIATSGPVTDGLTYRDINPLLAANMRRYNPERKMMKGSTDQAADSGNTALVIIQTLFCVLREKNILTRADIEEFCLRIEDRVANPARDPLPCCNGAAAAAASEMANICEYVGQKFGGKHSRDYWRR